MPEGRMQTVSVIVPTFGVEAYIEACLASIVEQTYPHLEIICVNDATNDNSVTIVRRFLRRDPRVRLLHHDVNRGLGAARNTGLRHASGTFIKFVDGDDALVPETIEMLLTTLERKRADWAFGDFYVVDEKGGRQSRSPFHEADLQERARNGVLDISADRSALNGIWPSAWMGLWRTDRIRATAARFPEGLHFEDHEFFFIHGFQSRSAAYLDRPLYVYRGHRPGQITRDVSDRVFEIFIVLERLFAVFERYLTGTELNAFSARTAVRLISERTWTMPSQGTLIDAYRRRAAAFLACFSRDVLFKNKDWYISDEALESLLAGSSKIELSEFVEECAA